MEPIEIVGWGSIAVGTCIGSRWPNHRQTTSYRRQRLHSAGATIPIYDPASGAVNPGAVFVAVLGASSYTFAEATSGQDLRIIPARPYHPLRIAGQTAHVAERPRMRPPAPSRPTPPGESDGPLPLEMLWPGSGGSRFASVP
jgi:hypothetical protein